MVLMLSDMSALGCVSTLTRLTTVQTGRRRIAAAARVQSVQNFPCWWISCPGREYREYRQAGTTGLCCAVPGPNQPTTQRLHIHIYYYTVVSL